jgi:hypothetical protein
VSGAGFAAAGGTALGALLVALGVGWALGWIGSITVHVRRRLNERITSPADQLAGDPAVLEQRHRMAIWLDALRGSVLVAAFLVPTMLLTVLAAGVPASRLGLWAVWSLVLGIAASAGAAGRTAAFGIRGWPLLLLGGAAGLLILGVLT